MLRYSGVARTFLVLLLLCFTFFLLFLVLLCVLPQDLQMSDLYVSNHRYIRVMPNGTRTRFTGSASDLEPDAEVTAETKLILLWTNWFGTRYYDWHFGLGKEPFRHWGCSSGDCVITRDRRLYEQADMIVFNFYSSDFTPAGFPARRWPDQLYVFVISESPATIGWPARNAHRFNGFFNLSMTYRADSDIRFQQILIEPFVNKSAEEKARDWSEIRGRVLARHGRTLAPVAWMVSNCRTHSRRDQYVRELQKYIPVHVYGKCGSHQCGDNRDRQYSCYQMLQQNYKFYLSFENSECKDYVTEKLANVLPLDMVPIVLGGTNYTRDSPPKSVINVYDFRSPRALAAYLKQLDRNPEKYLEYFRWKTDYRVINGSIATPSSYCKLCNILHGKTSLKGPKIITDMESFWPHEYKMCIPKMIRDHLWSYTENYLIQIAAWVS